MALAAPLAEAVPSLPRRLGRFTLFDRIGAGGMAEIFLARERTDLGVGRLAVVKQILPHLAERGEFTEMLIQEAKLAARLDHANVVHVLDLGREDGVVYIAMQYVEGFDLNELLRRCARSKTALPVPFALLIVREALRALDYAHRRTNDAGTPLGLVHRDVSPSNLLISLDGEIKLCDFGIARAIDAVDALGDEAVKGKAGYMSPEHARGEPLDARADVFAIGIVLWELLAGRKLYRATDGGPSLLDQARVAAIPALPSRGLAHETDLGAIVAKALAPSRDDRYESAAAMLRDLEAYVGKAGLVASPLRLADWLVEHFGADLVEQRRAHERAAKALDAPTIPPIATTPPPPGVVPDLDEPAIPESTGERAIVRSAPPPARAPSDDGATDDLAAPAPARGRAGLVVAIAVAVVIAVVIALRAMSG